MIPLVPFLATLAVAASAIWLVYMVGYHRAERRFTWRAERAVQSLEYFARQSCDLIYEDLKPWYMISGDSFEWKFPEDDFAIAVVKRGNHIVSQDISKQLETIEFGTKCACCGELKPYHDMRCAYANYTIEKGG